MQKWCSRGEHWASPSEFQAGYCRAHRNEYMREYRAKNPDKRVDRRFTQHGITRQRYEQMLAAQGGCCAICRGTEPGKQGWHIDHDHDCCPGRSRSCGQCVRGILCFNCNLAIGLMGDDRARLHAAIAYLERTSGMHKQLPDAGVT